MTVYELLFIVLFLPTVVGLVAMLALAVSGRGALAWKVLMRTGGAWSLYLVVLVITDITARQRVVEPGNDLCFDEMCFAVVGVEMRPLPSTSPDRVIYVVIVRATSHSRGRAQAEGGLRARLYADGRYFASSEQAQKEYELRHGVTPKITDRLSPGQSVESAMVFVLPRDVEYPALTLDHGFTPGYFVIGESPFFHPPDILQLPKAS